MNFLKAVRVISIQLWMASVWLWLLPGVVELGFWLLFVRRVFLGPLPDWLPYGDEAGLFLVLTGACVMFWVIAIRQRLDPVMGRLFGAVAIVTSVAILVGALEEALSTRGVAAQGSCTATLYYVFLVLVIDVGGGGLILTSLVRGLRKRQHAIPGLVKILTSSGKNARRKAIFVLAHLEALDRAAAKAARKDGVAWLRRLRRWASKSDTPPAMNDAVPALLGALRDDDLFVRRQAAKVLSTIGVTFAVDDRGLSGATDRQT